MREKIVKSEATTDTDNKEHIVSETLTALKGSAPSSYFEKLSESGELQIIFPEIERLKKAEQSEKWHPEGNAYKHTLQVVSAAKALGADEHEAFAALTHDLGKGNTPTEILPKHTGHEFRSVEVLEEIFDRYNFPSKTVKLSKTIAKNHMLMHDIRKLRGTHLLALLDELDFTSESSMLDSFILVTRADECGRNNIEEINNFDANGHYLKIAAKKASFINLSIISAMSNKTGEAAIAKLREARIKILNEFRKSWNSMVDTNEVLKNLGVAQELVYEDTNNSIRLVYNGKILASASMNKAPSFTDGILAGIAMFKK